LRLFGAPGRGAVAEVTLPARRVVDVAPAPVGSPTIAADELLESPNGTPPTLLVTTPTTPAWPRRAAIFLGVWILCGVLWTLQSYAYLRIRNRMGRYTLTYLTVHDVTAALLWACLAP